MTTCYDRSRAAFETYACMGAGELPADPVSALQLRLFRWEIVQFGWQPLEKYALGVAEEIGELNDSTSVLEAEDAIADVCVYLAQACTSCRLDFGVLLRGAPFQPRTGRDLSSSVGLLCHVALKASQKIRGYEDPEKVRRGVARAGLQLLVGLVDVCSFSTVRRAFFEVSERVMQRDWRSNPAGGGGQAAQATADGNAR